jgi:hypothetical protein
MKEQKDGWNERGWLPLSVAFSTWISAIDVGKRQGGMFVLGNMEVRKGVGGCDSSSSWVGKGE